MKRISIITLFILLLTACGQGGSNQTGSEPTKDGIETEVNDDLVGEEEETDSVETAGGEQAEEPTDEQSTVDNTNEAEGDEDSVENEPKTTVVELVFSDDQVMDMYRVERQIEAAEDDLFVATLEAWIAGPTEEGLVSLLPDGVKVESVTEKDGVAHVSFSKELLNAQVGSGTEEMLLQQVAMAMKQFGFNETQILIEGEVHEELFGHMDTGVPIVAKSLEDYEKVE